MGNVIYPDTRSLRNNLLRFIMEYLTHSGTIGGRNNKVIFVKGKMKYSNIFLKQTARKFSKGKILYSDTFISQWKL